MTDLLKLAERVETERGGVALTTSIISVLEPIVKVPCYNHVYKALMGSLDAAKSLHDAVLPEWGYTMHHCGSSFWVDIFKHLDDDARCVVITGTATNPAAAWAAAILRAKASEA